MSDLAPRQADGSASSVRVDYQLAEARFRAIFEHAGVGLSLTDLDGRFIECNRVMLESIGFSAEELRGRSFADLLHPDDVSAAWERYRSLAAGATDHGEFDARFVRKDGTVAWGHITTSFVRDDAGRPQYAIEVSENITQRKQMEVALAKQYRQAEVARSQMRAVLDATNEGVVLFGLDGQVLSVNRRVEEMFQVDGGRATGRRLSDYYDQIVRLFGGVLSMNTTMSSISDNERRLCRDVVQTWPERRELEVSSNPVYDESGQQLGRLVSFRDVTQERAADRLKSEFVSLVSHELRTPLTSIKGYVDLMLEDDAATLDGEQRDFLEIVRDNSERLVTLINDLLDMSRLESGGMTLQRVPIDLARLVSLVVASFHPETARRQQTLSVDINGPLPELLADADRIVQVLSNLVSNAQKYTPVGGGIRIVVQPEDGRVRVDVQDSGIGISAEDQARLFSRFFRAENDATRAVHGTGLGLMITRSLVLMHGGYLSVTSSPGKGSTFSFTLPLVPPAAMASPGK